MYFEQIPFASPKFDALVDLRNRLLRIPLNMQFEVKDIQAEWNELHFGVYANSHQLLGCLTMRKVGESEYRLRQVVVEEHVQGKGVGGYLMEQIEQWCKFNSINKIFLHARDVAIPFYKKLDYQIVGDEFEEVGIKHFRMEKRLN